MLTNYEKDVVEWAIQQANLLRTGSLDLLDIEHLANEIEDVAKREQRELTNSIVALLACLLLQKHQTRFTGPGWEKAIKAHRKQILYALDESPSLTHKLSEARWLDVVWSKVVALVVADTGLDCFPEICPWSSLEEVLSDGWRP